MTETGDLLQSDIATDRYEVARRGFLDPKTAMGRTLRVLLERIVFVTEPGEDGLCQDFNLNQVLEAWPEPRVELSRPAGSIIAPTEPQTAHNFGPTMLEDTVDCFGNNTVLWKTSEMMIDFQVDFWVTNEVERNAIAVRLPEVFNMTESRGGILVQGPSEYFARTVRFTLQDGARPDSSESVFERERRYQTTIRGDIDVVHLRFVRPLVIRQTLAVSESADVASGLAEPVGAAPNLPED